MAMFLDRRLLFSANQVATNLPSSRITGSHIPAKRLEVLSSKWKKSQKEPLGAPFSRESRPGEEFS